MARIFNAKVEEFEIIDTIIEYLDDTDINRLIDSNIVLRFRFKANKANKKKLNRTITDEKIKQVYKNDITLKHEIIKTWSFNVSLTQSTMKKTKSVDKHIKEIVKDNIPLDMFEYCTILWKSSNEDLNKKGDYLYEEFKKALEVQYNKKSESSNEIEDWVDIEMDNNSMNTSISEFIQNVSAITAELQNVKKELEDKRAENKKLKESLEIVIDNRELKKEIKMLNKKLMEVQGEVGNKNSLLVKELNEVRKENQELEKEIKNITKSLSKFNIESLSKVLIKNIIDAQTDINNSLKGGIIESVNKKIDNGLKSLEGKMNTIPKEIQIEEPIISIPEKKKPEIKTPKVEESTNSNGLADILKGLSTSL